MAIHTFELYYWAANTWLLKYCLDAENLQHPPWLAIEANSVAPVTLKALVHVPIQSSISPYTKIWLRIRYFGFQLFYSLFWLIIMFCLHCIIQCKINHRTYFSNGLLKYILIYPSL